MTLGETDEDGAPAAGIAGDDAVSGPIDAGTQVARTHSAEMREGGGDGGVGGHRGESVTEAPAKRPADLDLTGAAFRTRHVTNGGRLPGGDDAVDDENPALAVAVVDPDTLCGLGRWRPPWLQRLASKKAYVLIHGLIGLNMFAVGAYFVATISTIEKRFKIPSRTSGVISSAWDIGSCCSLLVLSYIGTSHKPRFVAIGTVLIGIACFGRMLPHVLYGAGQDALSFTREYGASRDVVGNVTKGEGLGTLCGAGVVDEFEDCSDGGSLGAPAVITFVGSLVIGVGSSVYFTLGVAYLDDNTRKNKAPLALAATQCIRMVGPTLGFSFAAYSLSRYVEPGLTPVIDQDDPRWIGAWWLGYAPGAVMCMVLAGLMFLFPRQLPRAAERRRQLSTPPKPQRQHSFKDFRVTFARLLKNRVLVFNTMSGVCFMCGYIGYWTFMPKYMETQYRQSASRASLISGSVGLIFMGLGVASSAIVISKFKPRPRTLAAWSVFVELIDVFGHFSWAFLSCGERDLHGDWASDNTWNLTATCNGGCECGPEVKYSPVCSMDGANTFYSPCHAGCNDSLSFPNGTTFYSGCACAPGGFVMEGPCARDCSFNFILFIASQCLMRFLGMSGKAGNTLIQFRCVDEDDKPLAIAFSEFLLCALAFIPGPIIYGMLLDSACLVWGSMCGQTGNCWLYEGESLRYRLNFTAAACLFCGMTLDIAVWYYCKDLQIYDEDDNELEDKNKSKNNILDESEKPFLEKP